jgi:hypothetical protein
MTKKRANGEGSVYKTKDGHVIGTWQDATGKIRNAGGTFGTLGKRNGQILDLIHAL